MKNTVFWPEGCGIWGGKAFINTWGLKFILIPGSESRSVPGLG